LPAAAATGRLFLCARCQAQILVCSHCDRGQIYCAQGCAQTARRAAQRAAGRRYQASRRGRVNHAARAGRYRARQNNVTHQGSPPHGADDLVMASAVVERKHATVSFPRRGSEAIAGSSLGELVLPLVRMSLPAVRSP
jgi:hypothetical protein